MSGTLGDPIDENAFNNFLFNGAAMYEDYANKVQTLDSIRIHRNFQEPLDNRRLIPYIRLQLFSQPAKPRDIEGVGDIPVVGSVFLDESGVFELGEMPGYH